MIKLLSGYCPGHRTAFDLTGSGAAYNWDWPRKLGTLPTGKVWPMVVNNVDSISRFKYWAATDVFDHVLFHNEPPIPNPGAAVELAEWTNAKRAELIAGRYMHELDTCIVGNFLIMPGNYADYAAEIAWFMDTLDFPAILGVHLYHNHAESPAIAALWQDSQLWAIGRDYGEFAVTEWGDLSSLWRAGEGPDIPEYSQYMRDVWRYQRLYNCYASAWYVGCDSTEAQRNADYVLTNQDGSLRPLGKVWRDLPTGDTVPTEPPDKPEPWHIEHEWITGEYEYRLEWRRV